MVAMLITGVAEYALQNRLTPFISMQNYHNAMYREVSPVKITIRREVIDLGRLALEMIELKGDIRKNAR